MSRRVALITGGGTGIGRSTARQLGEEGWSVAITGRRSQLLDEAIGPLNERGIAIVGDVSDPHGCETMVERTVDEFGGIDLLVNNAGVYGPASVMDDDEVSWRRHFEVNVHGPWRLCRLAHPHLKASRVGSVVNVLSTLAHNAAGSNSAYCSSKSALEMLTRCLALEWASDGIRVNAVSPGVVDTPIHEPGIADVMGAAHPLGRIGQPDEVARAIVFLASDASAWTTGANLDVDGGIRIA